jgi:hypothetical protein
MHVNDSYFSTVTWYRCEHANVSSYCYITTEFRKRYSSVVWLHAVNECTLSEMTAELRAKRTVGISYPEVKLRM